MILYGAAASSSPAVWRCSYRGNGAAAASSCTGRYCATGCTCIGMPVVAGMMSILGHRGAQAKPAVLQHTHQRQVFRWVVLQQPAELRVENRDVLHIHPQLLA